MWLNGGMRMRARKKYEWPGGTWITMKGWLAWEA